ncbi:MAG: response regulator [Desulfuromonadaceae bacterium]|nr:response regulator [Desulfuromonadaceae bacterium]
MAENRRKRFGDVLLEAGLITNEQLEQALTLQKSSGKPLGKILEEKNIIGQKDIAATLAHQFGFKTVKDIANHKFPASILDLIDSRKALQKQIFPLKVEGKKLYLAMVNPLDIETVNILSFATGLHIVPIITTPTEIYAAINTHYINIMDEKHADGHWRILVLDTPQQVHITEGLLRGTGYSVTSTTTSAAALGLCTKTCPHLIIAETQNAGLDTIGLYHALRHNNSTRNCPIIGLSYRATAAEEAKFLDMGFIDFIAKPVDAMRLQARIRRALNLLYQKEH